MAEIAIRAVDNTSGHPMAWKRGMPVCVMPDGHPWSPRESLPPAQGGKFVILKITDVTVKQVETFLQNRWGISLDEEDGEFSAATVEREYVQLARRKLHFLLDNLPAGVRNQLRTTGSYTTTWQAIRTFLQNRKTQETA